jgi:hypothetical protein
MPKQTRRAVDGTTWRKLIGPALRVVDSLPKAGYGDLDFRLGGGTVLMFRFNHRISKDIDIFTYDAQALTYLSPRLNEVAEHESLGYEEQANAVKLLLPDGDVDFIVAAPVIPEAPSETMDIGGRDVVLEATSEILAKKLLYRADGFKARDVFDMSTALAMDRASAIAALRATTRTRPALLRRLAALAAVPEGDLVRDVAMTQAGRAHAAGMVAKLLLAVAEVDGPATGNPPKRRVVRRRPDEGMEM